VALVACACGTTSRLPNVPTGKVRCAKCQHVFTPMELVRAVPEAPPAYQLNQEDDSDDGGDDDDYDEGFDDD
jgi:hypothetical protein